MRALLTALCRLLLRIFFRRIEAVNEIHVPDQGPVLYVLNHPNGLLDPLFILCLSPRPVVFLAKAPLFDTFLVKHFVRAFECLPVYRTSDGEDPSKNRASIEASIALLGAGRALALFPEGVSHSDPQLKPLKTGAARIALSASAGSPGSGPAPQPVQIVPVGLVYPEKTRFRSEALLVYGPTIITPKIELDANLRPPNDAAEQLTATIDAALDGVTLQARSHELLRLADDAEQILLGARRDEEGDASGSFEREPLEALEIKQRLIDGHERLLARVPAQIDAVVARIRRYQAELALLGLPLDQPAKTRRRSLARKLVGQALVLALLLPFALVGVVTHWPAYRFIDWLAHRMAKRADEILATLKLIAGFLFFPLTWLVLAVAAGVTGSWTLGLATALVLPLCGYLALTFVERLAAFVDQARALWVFATRRDLPGFLARERASIRDAIMQLAAQLDSDVAPGDQSRTSVTTP